LSARLGYAALALLLPLQAMAQDDGGTFLEGLLERSLAGEGRDVRVTGFRGALSSTATIERLTFADPQGVWLTIEDVVLDWNRAALLRGRLSVEELQAGTIVLDRLPQESADPAVPSPEASGFRLPELPVAVRIGRSSPRPSITFGAPVFGIESVFSLDGRLALESGEGRRRRSRSRGSMGRKADSTCRSRRSRTRPEVLALSLDLEEAPGGIVSTLGGIPGAPSVDLSLAGAGSVVGLRSDARACHRWREDRLSGTLDASAARDVGPDDSETLPRRPRGRHHAALRARVPRLLRHREVTLVAAGCARGRTGRWILTPSRLAADGDRRCRRRACAPARTAVRKASVWMAEIAAADGAPVLLPIPGEPTRVDAVMLDAAPSTRRPTTPGPAAFLHPRARPAGLLGGRDPP
jgi:translocation and assembly module TamB